MRSYNLIILILLFYSCKFKSYRREDKMFFIYNEPGQITSLDPAHARSMSNIWAINQIFNGLVQLNEEGNITPSIAKQWIIDSNGLRYTFFLRDDIYFHPGEDFKFFRRVVADDFVFSFNRIVDPSVASPGAWIFSRVKRLPNGKLFIKAVDDTTLIIVLNEAFPPFLGLLTMQYCSVVSLEAVKEYKDHFGRKPIGTGPFMFRYWKEGQMLVLVKNPYYFEFDSVGRRLPYLDAINVTFVADRQTAFLNLLRGNLHMISGLDASYKDAILHADGKLKEQFRSILDMQVVPFYNTEYLGFNLDITNLNHTKKYLHDKRVRKALNLCFDRAKMIRHLRNNLATPGIYGFVPPYMPGFDTTITYGYNFDPDQTRQLLVEAGYPDGKGLPQIELMTTPNYLDLCQYIQHEAAKFGINIKIEVTQSATLREMIAQGRTAFFRASWIADYPDAENYLALFYSRHFAPDGPNYTRFQNSFFDELYDKSIHTFNDFERWKIYRQMDSTVMSEAPVIVLYYDKVVRFIRKEVKGLKPNPMNLLILKYVWLEK